MYCKKNKVLHVVYAMNPGGIEAWLMSLYRNIDRDKLTFDFLVNSRNEGFFDKEVKNLGGNIIFGGKLTNPIDNYKRVKELLNSNSYGAVHCHNVENAFPVLKAAYDSNVAVRIYHCHNNFDKKLLLSSFFKKHYLKLSNRLSIMYATKLLSVSKEAGDLLFQRNKYQQVSLGIELHKYHSKNKNRLRKVDFNLSNDDIIIGHVGRFDFQKNHMFIVDIAIELIKLEPRVRFVLVGKGELESEVKKKINKHNLNNHVLCLGRRNDVPQLMLDIMDIFLFPSLSEGLGLVIVEAQTSGLPVVCSNIIPEEAIVNKRLVKIVNLDCSSQEWAQCIVGHYDALKDATLPLPLSVVSNSDFNLIRTIPTLESLWLNKK